MIHPLDAGLPGWMSAGLALGAVLASLVVFAFVVGARRFPDPHRDAGAGDAGEARRRAEVRTYLRSIGEPFLEDFPVDGRTVPFYLAEREVAVTFDARDAYRLDRTGTRAVLLEHEAPVAVLGARLPFEVPEPLEPAAAAAFARLGLSPAADAAAVRSAYRERAKAAHPDHGGDREAFNRLREAYAVARDRAD